MFLCIKNDISGKIRSYRLSNDKSEYYDIHIPITNTYNYECPNITILKAKKEEIIARVSYRGELIPEDMNRWCDQRLKFSIDKGIDLAEIIFRMQHCGKVLVNTNQEYQFALLKIIISNNATIEVQVLH